MFCEYIGQPCHHERVLLANRKNPILEIIRGKIVGIQVLESLGVEVDVVARQKGVFEPHSLGGAVRGRGAQAHRVAGMQQPERVFEHKVA